VFETDDEVSMVSKCVYNSSINPPQMKAATLPSTPAAKKIPANTGEKQQINFTIRKPERQRKNEIVILHSVLCPVTFVLEADRVK